MTAASGRRDGARAVVPVEATLRFPPGKRFSFADDPDPHAPCYVVMPDGASLSVNHWDVPGVDIARAHFIVDACNAALDNAIRQPACRREADDVAEVWRLVSLLYASGISRGKDARHGWEMDGERAYLVEACMLDDVRASIGAIVKASAASPSAGSISAEDLERAAEAVWQAESMRASGRPRQVAWADAADGQQEEFRLHARAAFEAAGLTVAPDGEK